MKQLNIYDAKTQLSHLVDEASKGKTFVIAKSGTPLAKLTPLNEGRRGKIKFGLMKGEIIVSDDFDAALPADIIESFKCG